MILLVMIALMVAGLLVADVVIRAHDRGVERVHRATERRAVNPEFDAALDVLDGRHHG